MENCESGRLPEHSHDTDHACVILQGAMSDRAWSGRRQPAVEGDIVLNPAGSEHKIDIPEEGLQCAVIQWPNSLRLNERRCFTGVRVNHQIGELAGSLMAINPARQIIAQHGLAAAVINAAVNGDYADPPGWLREVHHVFCQSNQDLGTGELAGIAGVHRATLSSKFGQVYGLDPQQFRMLIKLEKAAGLLSSGQTSSAAAYDAGFSDQAHLNRAWRRYIGGTPIRWQRQQATIVQDLGAVRN